MIPTPSPIQATTDQADTIRRLVAFGAQPRVNVRVDAAPLDETAHSGCDHDWMHGPGVVCTPDGYLCLPCALPWLSLHAGEQIAVDVLQAPVAVARAA